MFVNLKSTKLCFFEMKLAMGNQYSKSTFPVEVLTGSTDVFIVTS